METTTIQKEKKYDGTFSDNQTLDILAWVAVIAFSIVWFFIKVILFIAIATTTLVAVGAATKSATTSVDKAVKVGGLIFGIWGVFKILGYFKRKLF